jgi:thiosulfate reductase cytochrome b subunit
MAVWRWLRRVVPWLLLAVLVLYVVSGLGITEYRTVESITFGLLTKNLSFQIHNNLLYLFLFLLVLHIALPYIVKRKNEDKK